MKTLTNSRMEIVFALSLVAILGLPPLVLAQDTKRIEIKIENGDTTVNGKDIKKLTARERKDALSEMGDLSFKPGDRNGQADVVIRRSKKMKDDKNEDVIIERRMFGDGNRSGIPFSADRRDSARTFKFHLRKPGGGDSAMVMRFDERPLRMGDGGDLRFNDEFDFNERPPVRLNGRPAFRDPRRRPLPGFAPQDRQVSDFSYTDKDGINTSVSYEVSAAFGEDLKRAGGATKAHLAIRDLTLTPEFSTGKTLTNFNLPAQTTAEVKLTDSDGKVLFEEKLTGGSFSKKVSIPLNGVYFLVVKQGTGAAVKRIVKE